MVSKSVVMSLDRVVPYWRNPRRISDEAINAVAESIRQFGYQQPIAVDTENVIVVGHTRYAALRRLGYEKATVRVIDDLTQQQIKQLRVIDNKTSEYGIWDFESLTEEMSDLDEELMSRFFPEVAQSVYNQVVEIDESVGKTGSAKWDTDPPPQDYNVEFVCPACFHMWERDVTREDVLSGVTLKGAENG